MKKSVFKLPYLLVIICFGMGISLQAQSKSKAKKDTIKEGKIEEVIMIGYGTSKKSDLTGSVSVVQGSTLKEIPVATVAEALAGKVAGLTVTQTEGSPDAVINIKVRGGTSVTQDSSPLIIVDGFPVNSLNDIVASDIENISVLKDASSTAIYGSRGANGVVLVTTKSGKNGKVSVSFNSYAGYKFIANKKEVLSPYDYAKWQYEFASLIKNIPSYEQYFGKYSDIGKYKNYNGIDWQKEIVGNTGTYQNTDLSLRGGSDAINYNLTLAHYNEDGIMLNSSFKRDNVAFSLNNKPNKKITLGIKFRYFNTTIDGSGANEQKEVSSADSRMRNIVVYSPINVPALVTDDTDSAIDGYLVNPYVANADNNRKQERRNYTVQGSFGWKIVKNLEFNSDLGSEFYRYLDYRFYGRSTYYVKNIPAAQNQGLPALIFSNETDTRLRNSNTLNYDFKDIVGDNNSLKLLVGEEYILYKVNTLTNTMQGYPKQFTFENAITLTSQGIPFSVNNYYEPDDKLLSFFGRLNYGYKDKYLLTATFRADGSNKFLGKNKWGYFPSVAGAWKISSEDFMRNVNWVKLLKLRASYGEAGNNNIPTGQLSRTFGGATNSWINGFTNYWTASSVLPNPNLKWETTVTQDLGLDFELIGGRISGTVDLYKNKTRDLLLEFPVPGSGYSTQYRNAGDNENKGIEITLNVDAIRKKDFKLGFSVNTAFNKNKILSLGGLNDYTFSSAWNSSAGIGGDYFIGVGHPIGTLYGFVNAGRYEVSDFDYNATTGAYTLKSGVLSSAAVVGVTSPGSMKIKDVNGDGVIDANDRTILGNTNPKNTGGFNINAVIKNVDFSAGFNWSIGNKVYNADKIEYTTATPSSPNGQYRNLISVMADGKRWTNIDPNTGALVTDPTALAALNANTTLWSPYMSRYVFTSWAVEDGSFLRLNTLTLGYSFPDDLVKQLKLTKFRLYLSANNVFVITKYTGSDPEVSTRRKTPLTPGVDSSPYPRSKSFVFGINLNF